MPYHSEPQQFVAWLRAVAPYIHAFRGKTIVVGFAGELVTRGRLNALVALIVARFTRVQNVCQFRGA